MRLPKIVPAIILAAVVLAATPAVAEPAPKLRQQTIEQLGPLPFPYDEKIDARAAVRAAEARARANHKLLLLDFGGNWCADCRVLAGVMEEPAVRDFLARHYEVVTIDIGRFDRNIDIVHRFGIKELKGVPTVLIVNAATGTIVNRDRVFALTDARSISPQGLADWLARWTG